MSKNKAAMTEELIGVIVPVYKVEKYITECIESILAQTYTRFRLILVDDGTPDNAGKICDEYAKKDSRITVIHQENAGVTRARARGVEEASDCEWITFVDGDDRLENICLEALYKGIDDTVDIAIGPYNINEIHEKTIKLENQEYINRLIRIGTGIPHAMWGKLFRRKIFNRFTFDIPREITVGEDAIANIRLASNSGKPVVFINSVIYNYRILPDSVFHSFKDSLPYQEIFFKVLKESFSDNAYVEMLPSIVSRKLWSWKSIYLYSYQSVNPSDKKFIELMKEDIIQCKYHLTFYEYIQLYCPIKPIRLFFVTIHKITNYIKRLLH